MATVFVGSTAGKKAAAHPRLADLDPNPGTCAMRSRDSPDVAAILGAKTVVRRAIFLQGIRQPDADDLVQRVFLATWLSAQRGHLHIRHDAHGLGALRGYMRTTARRMASEHAHREPRELAATEDLGDTDPIVRLEARATLRRLLARLPPRERRVLTAIAEGATIGELAAEMQVPRGTVATWITSARAAARRRSRLPSEGASIGRHSEHREALP